MVADARICGSENELSGTCLPMPLNSLPQSSRWFCFFLDFRMPSHAFQYAMAGLPRLMLWGTDDDFWTWREEMYKCALSVDPDQAGYR